MSQLHLQTCGQLQIASANAPIEGQHLRYVDEVIKKVLTSGIILHFEVNAYNTIFLVLFLELYSYIFGGGCRDEYGKGPSHLYSSHAE